MSDVKNRYVRVIACVTAMTRKGAFTRQIPTFYLDTHVQGISSTEQAERVARKIINPLDTPAVVVDMTVGEVWDKD